MRPSFHVAGPAPRSARDARRRAHRERGPRRARRANRVRRSTLKATSAISSCTARHGARREGLRRRPRFRRRAHARRLSGDRRARAAATACRRDIRGDCRRGRRHPVDSRRDAGGDGRGARRGHEAPARARCSARYDDSRGEERLRPDARSELRCFERSIRLAADQPIELAPTFMGAHEVPAEYRDRRDARPANSSTR